MTAQIIRFETAALRVRIRKCSRNIEKLKGLKKVEPGPYTTREAERILSEFDPDPSLVEPDTRPRESRCAGCGSHVSGRQYLGIVNRGDASALYCWPCACERNIEPDVILESCTLESWQQCFDCWLQLAPGRSVVIDHNENRVHCLRCFNEGPP